MSIPDADALAAMEPVELARLTGQDGAWSLPQRAFRQHAEVSCPQLEAVLRAFSARVAAATGRPTVNPRLSANITLLTLNVYAAHREDERLSVAIPMSLGWYSAEAPRNPILSYRITVEQAVAGLIGQGFAERVRKGSPWGESYSLIRGTPALVAVIEEDGPPSITAFRLHRHHDPIVLKGTPTGTRNRPTIAGDDHAAPAEHSIAFPETAETTRMRQVVDRINAVNAPGRIRLQPFSEDEWWSLCEALRGKREGGAEGRYPAADTPLTPDAIEAWFSQTALYRVFNRGSFDQGGRFYGAAWQQLPRSWRRRILIDGAPSVELDYGSLHPRLAHHLLEGVDAPADCYASITVPRDMAKRTVSALLNMENGTARAPSWFRLGEAGMPWARLVDLAREALPGIAGHFGQGVGLRLQRVDSDMAEAVMLHFANRGVACLGVHDSFIVGRQHAAELAGVMREVYQERVSFHPVISAG